MKSNQVYLKSLIQFIYGDRRVGDIKEQHIAAMLWLELILELLLIYNVIHNQPIYVEISF